jgi:hypothetical protein
MSNRRAAIVPVVMRHASAFIVLAALAATLLGACSTGARRTEAAGNTVIDDTRDQPRPPPAPPDPPTEPDDAGGVYVDARDEYAPAAMCGGCACTPDAHYCFGGGTFRAPAEAGIPACALPEAGASVQVGCNALPAACAAAPTCDCILNAIQSQVRCYLVCQPLGGQLLVYCPTP